MMAERIEMATSEEVYREIAIATCVASLPKAFWENASRLFAQMYGEAFQSVANNNGIAREQRMAMLYQERHFRAERQLQKLAESVGVAVSFSVISRNSSAYCYVAAGDLGITQAYVQCLGAFPKPAAYRNALSAKNIIPRLDLGDEPKDMLAPKPRYALLAHNPAGMKFSEDDQRIGSLQVCIPSEDFASWGAELLLPEIVAAYPAEERRGGAVPSWKSKKDKGEG